MGMIVAAREVADIEQPSLGLLDVTVRRNAFGRQNESAEVPICRSTRLGAEPFPAIFIRAPWIERTGPSVEDARRTRRPRRDGAREATCSGTSFHPELTGDDRVHAYFLSMIRRRDDVGKASSAA